MTGERARHKSRTPREVPLRDFLPTEKCPTTGKVRYRSKAKARQAAKVMKGPYRVRGLMRPYQCEFCGGWHHTQQKRKKRDG